MNDLRDLSWQAEHKSTLHNASTGQSLGANYQPILPRQNNPFSQKQDHANGLASSRSTTPAPGKGDLFGDLVSFTAKKSEDNLSMAERAAALRAKKALEATRSAQHFSNQTFYDEQMSRPSSTTPSTVVPDLSGQNSSLFIPAHLNKTDTETSEDIMAQINGDSPVDRSSYYPPPRSPTLDQTSQSTDWIFNTTPKTAARRYESSSVPDLDSLAGTANDHIQVNSRRDIQVANESAEHDDDILGDLAKPIPPYETRRDTFHNQDLQEEESRKTPLDSDSSGDEDEDLRRAKAESLAHVHSGQQDFSPSLESKDLRTPYVQQIMEMGFTRKQAEVALAQTDTGLDVAAATDLLLSLQHGVVTPLSNKSPVRNSGDSNSRNQVRNEKGDWVDSTYDLASKTLASANSWFSNKSALARRKLAEYNTGQAAEAYARERNDDRPKWMRDAEKYERKEKGKAKAKLEEDEALREEGLPMHPAERKRLELNGVLPPQTHSRRGSVESSKSGKSLTGSILSISDSFRALGIVSQQSVTQSVSATDATRFKANDDEAATYVSSRRRRPITKPPEVTTSSLDKEADFSGSTSGRQANLNHTDGPGILVQEEDDLFGAISPRLDKGKGKARVGSAGTSASAGPERASAGHGLSSQPIEVDLFSSPRPIVRQDVSKSKSKPRNQVARQVPYVDTTIIASSSQQRQRGSEAFKRGDFAKALTHYDASLSQLPEAHPIRILSLANRAITHINLGTSKLAVKDCNDALAIIGPNHGLGEVVEDNGKQAVMTGLWAKVMQRKATALEMQEQIEEALRTWQEIVRSGYGTPQAMESRQRCEKLLQPSAKAVQNQRTQAVATLTTKKSVQASAAAVQRLRAETDKAAADDAERDELYSTVEDRINNWAKGKEQNLRALLSSLDQVLWPSSAWKKVSLADLVINAKVKIIYMKALAKVHPDKIARDASVEEKMIAAGVFSRLNGAWDAFKLQNNM